MNAVYELTEKAKGEQRSHVTAWAHLEAGASMQLCHRIIFKGADTSKSPARRRVLAWALRHGYLQLVRDVPKPSEAIAAIDKDIDTLLAKHTAKSGT